MNTRFKIVFLALMIISIWFCAHAQGKCCKKEIKDDEIAWEIMDEEERQGNCECEYGEYVRTGTLITFWEPIRIIETVKDPNCMITAGEDNGESDGDTVNIDEYGTHSDTGAQEDHSVFQQMHIILPDYIRDSIRENDQRCWHASVGNTEEYLSESDSAWQDDTLAAAKYPLTAMAADYDRVRDCMTDAASSQLGFPNDVMFWCMGAWGMTFPMSGHVNNDEYVTGNIAVAARGIYSGGRTGRIFDAATYYCYAGPMPQWIKSYFKFQPIRPVREEFLVSIGLSSMDWDLGLNPEETDCMDNFAWVLWRKRWC